jgi:hypothetical protein
MKGFNNAGTEGSQRPVRSARVTSSQRWGKFSGTSEF